MTEQTNSLSNTHMEVATMAGGCFWCLEACYQQLDGVKSVVSGYEGGHVDNPTYEQVCEGETGHAEVVRLTYDPGVVTFEELLIVFFQIHDRPSIARATTSARSIAPPSSIRTRRRKRRQNISSPS